MRRVSGSALLVLLALAAVARAPRPGAAAAPVAEDGALRARDGRLVVDEELRRFLDAHLAGGASEEAGRRALVAAFGARLPAGAAAEARELLDHYLDMRAAGRALSPARDPEARARQVRALRRDFLGDEIAAALFAGDEAELDAALARRRGLPALTAAEAETVAPLEAMKQEAGLDPAAVQALRERTFGPAAAARLAALDAERSAWRARLEDFRSRRAALADPVAQSSLLAQMFTPPEQARVRALERLSGRPLP